uniref:BESS domain-containing protein n=1 Tax=Elaeophora elaphi TaxID=1147741 RepID=A0A0R3S3W0_9BILA
MDLTRILDLSRPEKPTALLNRLREFLPEIANANINLNNATECDIDITTVKDESDASSSTDSDDEPGVKTKQPYVVMDVTTVMEVAPIRMVISDSDSDLDDDEEQQSLPVGFRTKKPARKRKQQHMMEEHMMEKCTADKCINNDSKYQQNQEELSTEVEPL